LFSLKSNKREIDVFQGKAQAVRTSQYSAGFQKGKLGANSTTYAEESLVPVEKP